MTDRSIEATTDDLLREANDPTTAADPLLELSCLDQYDWGRFSAEEIGMSQQDAQAVASAARRNPSLPPSVILHFCQMRDLSVWQNPLIEGLMMQKPHMAWRDWAMGTLFDHQPPTMGAPLRLERLMVRYASWAPSTPAEADLRHVASRIACLFGLPWPEEP